MSEIQNIPQLYDIIAEAVSQRNRLAGFAPGDKIFHLSTGYLIEGAGNEEANGEVSFRRIVDGESGMYQGVGVLTDAVGLKLQYETDGPQWAIYDNNGNLAYTAPAGDDLTNSTWVPVGEAGILPLPTITAVQRVYPSSLLQLVDTIFRDASFTQFTSVENFASSGTFDLSASIRGAANSPPEINHTLEPNPANNYGAFYVDGSDHLIYKAVVGGVTKTIDLGALA